MKPLTSVCLISKDVNRLRAFYQHILEAPGEGDEEFGSVQSAGAGLFFYSALGMERLAPGSMAGTGAGSCVLEFEVPDVDREYERLKSLPVPVVKLPATHPWGRRSFWFRDPDGNLVNFYAQVQPAAAE